MATIPDAAPNLSDQANALAALRSTLHAGAGGNLTALVVTEYVQYPADTDWTTIAGADEQVANVTRDLAGEGGLVRQRVIVGTIPDGKLPRVQ
jgi:hypothetical protein